MSSPATLTKDIQPTLSVDRAKKKKTTSVDPYFIPSRTLKARSPKRQRECLGDWDHAS